MVDSIPTNREGQAGEEVRTLEALRHELAARQAAEAALEHSEACLGRAQRIASLGNWELDYATDTLVCSSELYRIFGLPVEPATTRDDFYDCVHPDDLASVQEVLQDLRRGGDSRDSEFRIVRPDGTLRHVRQHAEVEADAQGERIRAIGAVQDITEYKRLEERFQTAQRLESVGRLAGGIAHDFNNLLTIINGYSDVLLQVMDPNAPGTRAIREIRKAGEKAAGLTHQLLHFSRKHVVQPVVMDVNATVRESESMMRRMVSEDVELTMILDPVAARIQADPGQFEQILMNLVSNACDALPEGGRIVLETASVELHANQLQGCHASAGPYVLLAISDNGEGMDEETRSHFFEPFYRAGEQGRRAGLGMSAVYGIVKQNGGWIWVYSEPGKGTTIKIYLPRVDAPLPAVTQPVLTARNLAGTETVLVVEDQEEVRTLVSEVLESYGYRILTAGNGSAALALCASFEGTIDLMVSDIVMPGISGRELADRVHSVRPNTKVLFMSGYTDNVAVYRTEMDAGAAFLQKPFSPQGLAGKVRETLGPAGGQATILVVDDEEPVRTFVCEVLAGDGYTVLQAENGTQALERVDSASVDLVITDLVMPEKEGIETILELRKSHPALDVVAMSGAFSGEYLSTARLLGAHATLAKPIDPVGLLALVQDILKKKRSVQ